MKTNAAKIKHLIVNTPQGVAGDLHKESRFAFSYSAHEQACEISLAMPLRSESCASGGLMPIFEMNRPEGYLLAKFEGMFAEQGRLDDMRLLAITGSEQIGRLSYVEPQAPPRLKDAQIGLKDILSRQPTTELFDFLVETYFDAGISGVQPKVLVPDAGRGTAASVQSDAMHANLIVKASGDDFPHLAQNEFTCMSAAKRAGIDVPNFWLSEDGNLFVIERFDLRDGRPLGFEDMAVLMNKSARQKYEGSYENVAKTVRTYCVGGDCAAELTKLFEYIAFSVMIHNGDGHLKNFGLLYEHPADAASIRLAPLYDVVTTSIYGFTHPRTFITKYDRTLALKLAKSKNYPDRAALVRFGIEHCNVARPEETLERIADALSDTLKEQAGRVDPQLLKLLRPEWDLGLTQ